MGGAVDSPAMSPARRMRRQTTPAPSGTSMPIPWRRRSSSTPARPSSW
jgi:hypothetical protein